MGCGHEYWMLDGEDEPAAGDKGPMDGFNKAVEILDVVEGEGAVGEIEGGFGQCEALEIRNPIFDHRVRRAGSSACDHIFGQIDAKDGCRAVVSRPSGEPAEAAAE